MTHRPEISLHLCTYSEDPNHDWNATLDTARAMDAAGVDRVMVSDHIAFGENLAAYANPAVGEPSVAGNRPGPTVTGWNPLSS